MTISRENYQLATTEGMQTRLNSILQSISDRLDRIEGFRGEASIESDLNMNENSIKNVDGLTASGDVSVGGDLSVDGDLLFGADGGGLAYAEISAVDQTTETEIVSSGVAVQITIFDTNGLANGLTPDHTEDHITITTGGTYLVLVSATINSVTGAASRFEISVCKNNGEAIIIAHVDRNVGGGGAESGVISMSGHALLSEDDTIEVWIENETNTQNYIVEDISLCVIQIGGG